MNPRFISYTRSSDLAQFLSRVATEYDALQDRPYDMDVSDAYSALARALDAQYTALTAYLPVYFTDYDPYPASSDMFDAIDGRVTGPWNSDRERGWLEVFKGSTLPVGHPFTAFSPIHGLSYNLIFRAVHDGLAHYPGRLPFSFGGEFWAFRAHVNLLSGNGPAIRALATETLGQNAWFNFGPRSHETPKPYAEQKIALLSERTIARALCIRYGASHAG